MSLTEQASTDETSAPLTRAWLGLAGGVTLLVVFHLLALVLIEEALLPVIALEGVGGVVVAGGLLAGGEDWPWALAAGVASVAGASATWLATTQAQLWLVAIGGAVLATITGYAIHRYELLTMGLLEETR